MKKNEQLPRSLDDAARLAGGYMEQSLPEYNPERDRMISEALAKRKLERLKKVRS